LFAHVDHPLARREQVELDELHGLPLLLREQGSTTRTAIEAALQAAGVKPRTQLEIGSREAIREAVARGLGIGAVSEAEFIADPRFRPVRIAGDPASTTTYVYCMKERSESLLVRSFFKAIESNGGADLPTVRQTAPKPLKAPTAKKLA
jgi:DNA-binding transcriptional LysR family regulator